MDYTTGRMPQKSHTEIVNQSAKQLIKYGAYLLNIEKWYDERGLKFPKTSFTNYKDAMFHYKKIYEHSDIIKVFQEQYAMEEHLIRAHKDALIQYINILRQSIESIYLAFSDNEFLRNLPTIEECEYHIKSQDELNSKYKKIDFSISRWIIDVMYLYASIDLPETECVRNSFAIYFHRHINDLEKIKLDLQKCIHVTTNFSLKLRINGTEIYRPMNDNDYNEECVRVFEEVTSILDGLALEMALTLIPRMIFKLKTKTVIPNKSTKAEKYNQEKEIAAKQVKEDFLKLYSTLI